MFDFLGIESETKPYQTIETFVKRPFIGSFVREEKCNDLALWRTYGKEELEEAKGCSLTINVAGFKNEIKEKINIDDVKRDEKLKAFEFYNVAYFSDGKAEYSGALPNDKFSLNNTLDSLKRLLQKEKDLTKIIFKDLIELLNEIAFLFKSSEYSFENEVRMVVDSLSELDIKIDYDNLKIPYIKPRRVYVDLIPITNIIDKIVLGPKVEKSEEWAATFSYDLLNKGKVTNVIISKLPFK